MILASCITSEVSASATFQCLDVRLGDCAMPAYAN